MKRIALLFLLVMVFSGLVFAQADISGIGTDFENLIEQLGLEMLPNIEQLAAWGQFPGQAALPEDSKFFFTLSGGTVLGLNGLLGFVEETNSAFEVLNVYELFQAILSGSEEATAEQAAAIAAAQNAITSVQKMFPYPISRAAVGFRLPADLEAMVDFAILPQALANGGVNIANKYTDANIPPVTINALHIGSRLRKVVLRDAPGIPAISIGAGYSYTGFNIGYDFGELQPIETAIGTINFDGQFFLENRVHSFGLDFQISKTLGFFVPFIGFSPYYQMASVSGGIGKEGNEFDAYVDFGDDDDPEDPRDIEYDADPPNTTLSDNDLSLVLFGGFDMVFGKIALQVHSSYNVGEGYPAVTLGLRWQ